MSSLKKRTISAVLWDFLGNGTRLLLSFTINIILTRILMPEDFGIISMVLVVVHVSEVFIDVGFSASLIQNQSVTQTQRSSVFYLNLLFGFVLTVLFILGSGVLSDFYQVPQISSVAKVLSLNFLISSCVTVQVAQLKKNLDFKLLSKSFIVSNIFSGLIAIPMTYLGYGLWSLVALNLSQRLIYAIIIWIYSPWRPSMEFSLASVREFYGFSGYMFLNDSLSKVFSKLDAMVIGKIYLAATLGFYDRGKTLNNLVTALSSQSFTKVFFPVFSKLQGQKEKLISTYERTLSVIGFLGFYLLGVLYLAGEHIIVLLYSEKWIESVSYFKILILNSYSFPLNAIMVNLLIGMGRADLNFRLGVIKKSITGLNLLVAVYWGILPFLYSQLIVSFLAILLNMNAVKSLIKLNVRRQLRLILSYAICSLAGILLILRYEHWFAGQSSLVAVLLIGLFFTLLYLILNLVISTPAIKLFRDELPFLKFRRNQ